MRQGVQRTRGRCAAHARAMLRVRSAVHGPLFESRVLYEREQDLNEQSRCPGRASIFGTRLPVGHKADLARKKLTIQKVASFWKRANSPGTGMMNVFWPMDTQLGELPNKESVSRD